MKTILLCVMLVALSGACWGQAVTRVAADCKIYISEPNTPAANLCVGYIKGTVDEMEGETFINDSRNGLVVGRWHNAGLDQIIRLFIKYTDTYPELRKELFIGTVLRRAGMAENIYVTKPLNTFVGAK